MGKHTEWRKIAKRERRRRIRTSQAKLRDYRPVPASEDECDYWLKEQEALELYQINEIEISNKKENDKWMQAELIAMEQWKKLQAINQIKEQKQLALKEKLKLELEMEKQRKEKEEQLIKEMEQENKRKQEEFMVNLEKYLNGHKTDPPPEILLLRESKPGCEPCPFFLKTACCRFGDECSRNHKYPGISKVLLAANLFVHFGLENTDINEYDTDIMLEYEDSDTYKDFKEFFHDVVPEFKKFGKITQFKVCNNFEKHLRGNTYIEYEDLRCAVLAYRSLHSRWYGGKQLSLQFCQISSWNRSICGLQSNQRCPKGRACNFLHVFRNPVKFERDDLREHSRHERTSTRSWRWSESPERDTSSKSTKERNTRKHESRRKHHSHKSKRHRNR